MRMSVVLLLGALFVLAGCGEVTSSATPAFSRAGECERSGGYWHPALNVCEISR